MTRARQIPAETLVSLRQRLDTLPARCHKRRELVESTAHLFGISNDTLYRALRRRVHVSSRHRADCGKPRKLSVPEMERYCEVPAAFKIRTLNKKGRYVSTKRAIELLEELGMKIENEFVKPPAGILTVSTVNRYLKLWESLIQDGRVPVSKSLSVDKARTARSTLISALFYDLSPDKDLRIPGQGEKREPELRDLIKKGKKPAALFVDEAHDLHSRTPDRTQTPDRNGRRR